jgi:hypothetical protein
MKPMIFKQVYGEFSQELDGRLSGQVITVNNIRKDGKFSVTHAFGNGKRINKIYTKDQLAEQLEKFTITA